MESWALAVSFYLASVLAAIAAAVWYARRPPGQRLPAQLPAAALVVIVFLGLFGIAFLAFWYLVHKPYRDAIGPPPS